MLKKILFLTCLLTFSLTFIGCNTTSIGISDSYNPAPSVPFSEYKNFELKEIAMLAPYAGQAINEKAKEKLQAEFDLKLKGQVEAWNSSAESRPEAQGTLLIEPIIKEIKFISGSARFWGGALTGDSAVVMEVFYKNKESGQVISKAEFYQHANAYGAAWSVGGTDKAMLARIATLVSEFTTNNFQTAVGGPTGKPAPKQ